MDHFRKRVTRKVDKDRTISLDGRLYEAPVALIGKTVTLLYHERSCQGGALLVNGTSYGMVIPLDVRINAKGEKGLPGGRPYPRESLHRGKRPVPGRPGLRKGGGMRHFFGFNRKNHFLRMSEWTNCTVRQPSRAQKSAFSMPSIWGPYPSSPATWGAAS